MPVSTLFSLVMIIYKIRIFIDAHIRCMVVDKLVGKFDVDFNLESKT